MNLNKAMLELYQGENHRKVGRYNSSDIYNIIKGDITPENYFDKRELDVTGLKNIWRGISIEQQFGKDLEKLGYKLKGDENGRQMKYEVKIEDFVVVVCPDFHILNGKEMGHKQNEFILETKCPLRIKDEIPIGYAYQLEFQHQAIGLPIYLVQLNVMDNDGPLVCPIIYKPSAIRYKNVCEKLSQFNKELKKYNER